MENREDTQFVPQSRHGAGGQSPEERGKPKATPDKDAASGFETVSTVDTKRERDKNLKEEKEHSLESLDSQSPVRYDKTDDGQGQTLPNNGQTLEVGDGERGNPVKRSTLKLWGRAFKEKWAVPEDKRDLIIRKLFEILDDPEAKYRTRISATKVLLEAYNSNLLWGKAEAGIDDNEHTVSIRLIKEAPGEDPGARMLRERFRDE